MRIALIQFNAKAEKQGNLLRAAYFVEEALKKGAAFVLLPEIFNWRGDVVSKEKFEAAENIPGETLSVFMSLASRYKAHILLGSILEKSSDPKKLYNTSILIDANGSIIGKYRKIHLFDARLDDKIIRESDSFISGDEKIICQAGDFTLGLSICYDLRFADLYRAYTLMGANVLVVPSCFMEATGRAHWEVLLRARAIENLAYVLAPNQVGIDDRGMKAYGHSMVISPWGEVLAEGSSDAEEIIFSDMKIEAVQKARAKLPSLFEQYKRDF